MRKNGSSAGKTREVTVARMPARARATLALIAALAAVLPGPGARANDDYEATIRRTEYGIPHINANGWGNLGFGVGYAFAQDNICVMADTFVTVNAERARFFDPNGTYRSEANGVVPRNLDSDFYYQWINESGVIEGLVDGTWPNSNPLSAEVRDISEGWVAGYNKYLADVGGSANVPDPTCRGAEWVRPITSRDLYRRYYQLIMFASKGALLPYIVGAQPPIPTVTPQLGDASMIDRLPTAEKLAIGSNAWALGEASTPNGRGMLLGNPHFPWRGPERFYEFHLTWPGKVNVMGGALFGSPLVHIGTNDHVAWSHTVSVPYRFTPYELKLVPGDPTAYLWDGGIRRMKAKTVTVQVKQPDNSMAPASHTFYEAHFGPVINFQGALMPWTPALAYALNDANENNFRALEHFADVNRAGSAEEVYNILARHVGIPWVNTIVADDRGAAFYADMSVVPHVLNDKLLACATAVGEALKALARLPVLDGSRSECQPGSDPDAPVPGILGASHLPNLFRRDYVANSNNSHWLPNEYEPLEGYPYVTGAERAAITPRARLGLTMIREKLAGGGTFTLDELQDTVFNDRQYLGELVRDDLAGACDQTPLVPVVDQSPPGVEIVDISAGCGVLRAWDLKANLGSSGTALFREFVNAAYASNTFWQDTFDPNDPVDTPRKLNTSSPDVRQGLARAVRKLRNAGVALDARLGDIQRAKRNSDSIPIHGGSEHGMFNYILSPFNAAEHGYTDTTYGSSFVITATFDGIGKPRAEAILTYSLSTNPASPHFGDQTWLYSQKQWVPLHMDEEAIANHLVSSITVSG
jgi:acyl-homoserine-lactone acylase